MRSYTQMDRAAPQRVDVVEGLESTLVMLAPQAPARSRWSATTRRTCPRIDAYAGELNQVWTNLIDNAIDAIDGVGTLRVTTRADDAMVVVEIGDTGPGLAAGGGRPRVRRVLHHQGRRPRHRARPRHRPPGRGRAAQGAITIGREGDETVVRVTLPR